MSSSSTYQADFQKWTGKSMSYTTVRRRVLYELRSYISLFPSVHLPIARKRRKGKVSRLYKPVAETWLPRAIDEETEIVLEGFERSGNTFALTAFAMAQDRPVVVAHHLHSASQIVEGVRRGLPVVLLIRNPDDAVLSVKIHSPAYSLAGIFRVYNRLYRNVEAYRDKIVVADFKAVTGNFGAVIRAVNEKFGTDFKEFDHSKDNVDTCFKLIEERWRHSDGEVRELGVGRPSQDRKQLKAELLPQLEAPELAKLRQEAFALYNRLVGDSDG